METQAENTLDDGEQDFQRDIQRAIEASKIEQTQSTHGGTQASSGSKIFLSERAKLEKERLARLKRNRGKTDDRDNSEGGSNDSQQLPVKRSHLSSVQPTDRRVHQLQSTPSISSSSSSSSIHERSHRKTTGIQAVPVIGQLFWEGELRPTANKHSLPREDGKATFRLSEVLGLKADICFAIISSYSTSVSWIYEFFDPRTPVILVSQPDSSGKAAIKNVLPNWIMTVPFLRYGRGCQHMKMIIATLRRASPLASSSKSGSKVQSTHPTSSDKGKSKVIVISDSETESENDAPAPEVQKEPIGWAYVGSHNFTPSAWGTTSGSGFSPTLNVVNYELGIVFPLYDDHDVKRVSCFKRPPRKYDR